MSKLAMIDLAESKELDRKAMAGVYGGTGELTLPSSLVGILTETLNQVNDTDQVLAQAFTFVVPQTASNSSIKNIAGGNGAIVNVDPQYAFNYFGAVSGLGNATSDSANTNF